MDVNSTQFWVTVRSGGPAFLLILACLLFFSACDQGLAPESKLTREPHSSGLGFGIQVFGGNPIGSWMHAGANAIEARLQNPDKIKELVDSLALASFFGGILTLAPDSSFEILGQIVITPTVWIGGSKLSFPPFVEQLQDSGRFRQPWADALILPLHTQTFKIDTVGFTATADSLTLVTLPSAFPYPGIEDLDYFLILRFVRADSSVIGQQSFFRREHHE